MVSPFHMPRGAKWIWSSMNQYRMFFIQTSTSKYRSKTYEHGKCYIYNNKLSTKTPDKIKDYSKRKILGHMSLSTKEFGHSLYVESWDGVSS